MMVFTTFLCLIHFWPKINISMQLCPKLGFFMPLTIITHSFLSTIIFYHRSTTGLWKLDPGEVTSRLFENVDKICRNKYIIIILDGTRNYTGYMEDILVFLIFDKPLWNGKCFVGPNVAGVYYSQKRLHFLAAILVCLITKYNKNW